MSKSNSDACPIFSTLSSDEHQRVLSLMKHEEYPEGETILREGLSTQILWIIVRGRCEVIKKMKDGAERQLAVLDEGTVFGEMSFFEPAPHSASIRALSEVEVMRLSREDYDGLQQSDSLAAYKIAANIVKVLAERLRRMDDWTYDLIENTDVAKHREEWHEFRAKLYADWDF